jgi:hypothetical protein
LKDKGPTELTLGESLQKVSYQAQLAPHRINLKVPFDEKDQAKALGAKWDAKLKRWYIDADVDMGKYRRWLP